MGLLFLAPLLLSFVCPPIEEEAKRVGLGQPCGGTCDTLGLCSDGLKCVVTPKTVSPFSFAIVSFGVGGTKAGVCQQEDAGRQLAGGVQQTALDKPEIVAAAKQAVALVSRSSNSLTPPTLKRIVSATSQVVAGIKYVLTLEMTDGSQHHVELVDTPWLTPRWSLVKHDVLS